MKTEIEIRNKRAELEKKQQELKKELRMFSSLRNEILAEIGESAILIWWFDWILGEKEERQNGKENR